MAFQSSFLVENAEVTPGAFYEASGDVAQVVKNLTLGDFDGPVVCNDVVDLFSETPLECLERKRDRAIIADRNYLLVFALILDGNERLFRYERYQVTGNCDLYLDSKQYDLEPKEFGTWLPENCTDANCVSNVTDITYYEYDRSFVGRLNVNSSLVPDDNCIFEFCSLVCLVQIAVVDQDFTVRGDRRRARQRRRLRRYLQSDDIDRRFDTDMSYAIRVQMENSQIDDSSLFSGGEKGPTDFDAVRDRMAAPGSSLFPIVIASAMALILGGVGILLVIPYLKSQRRRRAMERKHAYVKRASVANN
jgi:hypothetical protein